jgi:hypothetical protein
MLKKLLPEWVGGRAILLYWLAAAVVIFAAYLVGMLVFVKSSH